MLNLYIKKKSIINSLLQISIKILTKYALNNYQKMKKLYWNITEEILNKKKWAFISMKYINAI